MEPSAGFYCSLCDGPPRKMFKAPFAINDCMKYDLTVENLNAGVVKVERQEKKAQ